jgi:hypothetical protein
MVVPKIQPRIVVSHLVADLVAPLLPIILQLLAILDTASPIVGHVASAIAKIRADARPDPGADTGPDPRPDAAGSVGDAATRTGGELRRAVASARPGAVAGQAIAACWQLRWSIAAILEKIARGTASAWPRPAG